MRARALADKAAARHPGRRRRAAWIRPKKPWRSRANIDDPALVARALTACGGIAAYNAEVAARYFAEAIELARGLGDQVEAEPDPRLAGVRRIHRG